MQSWDKYLLTLDNELGKKTVNRWLRTLKIINYDAANLYLEAADTFAAQWFDEYASAKIKTNFRNENQRLVKVHLRVAQKKPPLKSESPLQSGEKPSFLSLDTIDPSYTFEHLVEISQNSIILKLFQELSQSKKSRLPYNPMTIFGPEGSGKSHLLQAMTHALKQKEVNVIYVRASTFTHNMVSAIKTGRMAEFRKLYRKAEVLIIDDIHYFSNKQATQEELFHTFNALHVEGRQMILSSNCSPQQLKNIEPRLTSRFEWGITLPLLIPTHEQMTQIFEQKLHEMNFILSHEIKEFMIKTFSKSPKTLQRALSALILRSHLKLPQGHQLKPSDMKIDEIKRLLKDLIKKESSQAISVDFILERISQYFGISIQEILSKSQSRECVLPRQMSMFFCRKYLKLPYMKIGRIFSRDHSTVMSSVKLIQKNISQKDHDFAKAQSALENLIFETSSN